MAHYEAIVVGSGIGGLAAGLLLSHQGKKTLVAEKNSISGGRLTSFQRDGFHIDLGVHVLSRSDKGPIGEVLRRVGIQNPITYTHVRPLSSYKGNTFTFPHDLKKMVPEADFSALMEFLGDIRSMPEEKVTEYDHVDLRSVLFEYTKEPFVHACIWNICSIYMCVPTWTASAGEFMRCLRMESQARSSGYPQGGCAVVADTYGQGIKKFGGEIRLGAGVQKISVENGKVSGLFIKDEFIKTDIVVSNADIKNTVFNLVGADYFPGDFVEYVKGLQYSWGGPVVRVALDRKLTDIKMLTQIGSNDPEAYYKMLSQGHIPEELNLFMVCPSNFSPTVAPEGKQLISMAMTCDPETVRGMNKEVTEAILDTAEKYVPGMRKHAMWVNTMGTNELEKMLGENGAGIGIAQIVGQCGDKRPCIKTPLEGLYIVGGEAGGTGVGTEMCVNSAIEFMDTYCPL